MVYSLVSLTATEVISTAFGISTVTACTGVPATTEEEAAADPMPSSSFFFKFGLGERNEHELASLFNQKSACVQYVLL